jgi:hypothetical protein
MEALIWIVVVAAVVAGLLISWHLRMRRRQDLASFALAHGLEFSIPDPFGLLGLPFRFLTKGDGRGVENVVWGAYGGQPLKAFDYWYYEQSTSSEGTTSRTYHRFSCVVLELPAAFPALQVMPEGVLSRLADHVGLRDLEMESEEFNRRYQVDAGAREFAYEVVDARMIRWLLGLGWPLSFALSGPYALLWTKRMAPSRLATLMGAAGSFRKRIPRMVWGRYGLPAEGSPSGADLA